MQIIFMLSLVLTIIIVTVAYRRQRDRQELTGRVRQQGGQVVKLARVRKGHPFPDVGRGWWAWRIDWRGDAGERRSWALTTREGIKEWRD